MLLNTEYFNVQFKSGYCYRNYNFKAENLAKTTVFKTLLIYLNGVPLFYVFHLLNEYIAV